MEICLAQEFFIRMHKAGDQLGQASSRSRGGEQHAWLHFPTRFFFPRAGTELRSEQDVLRW